MAVWYKRANNITTPLSVWTTATRPASPVDGQLGKNTTIGGLETYDATLGKWKILNGVWTTSTRPTGMADGSIGLNTDTGYGLEAYNSGDWQLI